MTTVPGRLILAGPAQAQQAQGPGGCRRAEDGRSRRLGPAGDSDHRHWQCHGRSVASGKAAPWLHWRENLVCITRLSLYPASRVSGRGPARAASSESGLEPLFSVYAWNMPGIFHVYVVLPHMPGIYMVYPWIYHVYPSDWIYMGYPSPSPWIYHHDASVY